MSIFTLGLPDALTYFISQNRARTRTVLTRAIFYSLLLGVLGTAILILLSTPLAGGTDGLAQLITIAAIVLTPCLLLTALRGVAAAYQLWGIIATERLVGALARLAMIGSLAIGDQLNVVTATVTLALTSFIGIVVYVAMPSRVASLKRGSPKETTTHRVDQVPLVRFGLRVWMGSLAGVLLSRIDQILLTPLSSTYELGLYVVAVSVADIILVVNSAVREVLFSVESERRDDLRLARSARVSTLVTFLLALLVGVVGIWGLPVLFGADFASAVLIMEILLLAIVLGNPGSVAGAGLSARNRPGLRSWSLGAAVLINVVLVIVLVPTFGAAGAAWATVAGNSVAGGLNVYWLRRHFGMRMRDFYQPRRADVSYLFETVQKLLKRE